MEHISHFFMSVIDRAGYPGLFFVMMLGNMGFPVGAELVVPAAGALAATGHLSNVWLAATVATAGEVVGGTILYAIGFAGGRPFVARYGKFLKLDEAKLDKFHNVYERYGNVVVFVCRFLPFVRGVSALPAGVARMQKRYFLAYTAAGSAIFCFLLAYLGSQFGRHFDEISPQIHKGSTIAVAGLLLIAIAFVVVRVLLARRRTSQP
ncbi:MAG: DedA family protein [Candidatus Eremiobacteraeota bacterium]|nr:DedA family protein [Candidatus Eremiobacteraeota bacterium]